MSRAKRHHYVPAAYLARFGENGRVLVRRRGTPKLFVTSVKNIAVESGFYEVSGADGRPSDVLERALSRLENKALSAVAAIGETGQLPPDGSAEREILAEFLAIQFTRTPFSRERILFSERVAEYVGEREINADLMAEFLQKVHLKFKPRETEVQGALDYTRIALQDRSIFTKDNVIRLSMMFVGKLQAAILARHWSLEVARRPRLITSDSPLILWRKPSSRDQFTGLGLDNAEEIRFPVSPAMQLVLSAEGREPVRRIEPDRVRACNADVALACYNAVIGHPRRTQQLQRLNLPAQPPALRFNIGPGYQRRPDGTYEEIGDILHMWTPRR